MVVFLLFCYDLFLYGMDFFALTNFMETRYGDLKQPRIRKNILLLFLAVSSGILLWSSPFGGTYPFFSVIFSFIFLSFYEGNRQKKILFSSIQLVISGYLVTLTIALLKSLAINLRYIGINYYITLGAMHLTFWLFLLLLEKFSRKNSHSLPDQLLGVLLAIPFSSFIVLIFFLIRANNNPAMLFSLEIPLLCVFLFINLMTAFLYSQFCSLLQKSEEVLLLRQQINLSEKHFQDLTGVQEKIKGIRHDMKNHLQALLLLCCQTPPPTDAMQEYIQKLLSDINDTSQIISTGNLGIDAILSLKINLIREAGIPVNSKIIIPAGIQVSFDDSIIIFGNILDNAINACRKLPPENRWIHLELAYIPHTLFIRISNPAPAASSGAPASCEEEHGFGLKNVHTAIQKYNGTMDTENNRSIFSTKIVLYHV